MKTSTATAPEELAAKVAAHYTALIGLNVPDELARVLTQMYYALLTSRP